MEIGAAYLDRSMRGWIFNTASKNHWRVPEWYELRDLVQDGYTCFYKCARRYTWLSTKPEPSPEERRHFMALVQTTFINHITNLSIKRTANSEEVVFARTGTLDNGDSLDYDRITPLIDEDASLRVALNQAPQEIRALFELLARDGASAVKYLRTRLRKRTVSGEVRYQLGHRKLRETPNEHYCRRLGLDASKVDLLELLRKTLGLDDAESV